MESDDFVTQWKAAPGDWTIEGTKISDIYPGEESEWSKEITKTNSLIFSLFDLYLKFKDDDIAYMRDAALAFFEDSMTVYQKPDAGKSLDDLPHNDIYLYTLYEMYCSLDNYWEYLDAPIDYKYASTLDTDKTDKFCHAGKIILGTLLRFKCTEVIDALYAMYGIAITIHLELAGKHEQSWRSACISKGHIERAHGEYAGRTGIGRQGGSARQEKNRKLKEMAIELYKSQKWRNKNQAAIKIAPLILIKSKELRATMSSDRVKQTVYDWICQAAKKGPD